MTRVVRASYGMEESALHKVKMLEKEVELLKEKIVVLDGIVNKCKTCKAASVDSAGELNP